MILRFICLASPTAWVPGIAAQFTLNVFSLALTSILRVRASRSARPVFLFCFESHIAFLSRVSVIFPFTRHLFHSIFFHLTLQLHTRSMFSFGRGDYSIDLHSHFHISSRHSLKLNFRWRGRFAGARFGVI